MLDLVWLDHMPNGTLESGIQAANRIYWALNWEEYEGKWFVRGGEDVLLRTDSREVARAFLYGMALAYSAPPSDLIEQLEAGVRALVGDEPPSEVHLADIP